MLLPNWIAPVTCGSSADTITRPQREKTKAASFWLTAVET
jgi:hypothetical protein